MPELPTVPLASGHAAVVAELEPMRERARPFEDNIDLVRSIAAEGAEAARDIARATLDEVRGAIGIAYR